MSEEDFDYLMFEMMLEDEKLKEEEEKELPDDSLSVGSEMTPDEIDEYASKVSWKSQKGTVRIDNTPPVMDSQQAKNWQLKGYTKPKVNANQYLSIKREAFDQSIIDLQEPIRKDERVFLVRSLTADLTRSITRYEDYINKRIGALLRPYIPKPLIRCFADYPRSMVRCQGFVYQVGRRGFEKQAFWTTPNIPHYFEQGSEMDVLRKYTPVFLNALDSAVIKYHIRVEKRAKDEVKYANLLLRGSVNTFYDLLKTNPKWFNIIYQYYKEQGRRTKIITDKDEC